MTNTTITIDLLSKKITYSGEITIREIVLVSLINAQSAAAADLILRILDDNRIEMAACRSFTLDGTTMKGTLDLSGADLETAFIYTPPDYKHRFNLQVWSNETGAQSLLVGDVIMIMNNPLTAAIQAQTLTEA